MSVLAEILLVIKICRSDCSISVYTIAAGRPLWHKIALKIILLHLSWFDIRKPSMQAPTTIYFTARFINLMDV